MSGLRKLQTEIERVMKKVDEGVELFDEIWEKVYSAEQQNQKEKYEVELKKEIKKLQRLRDQIKTWIGSSEVKDKDSLIDARKLIETKMEQFKICEKETKTKTYSKEGLAREEKLDPAEQAKEDTIKWISDIIDQLQGLVEDREVEIEKLSSGKGKKTNKNLIDECNQFILNHKFHMNKLEGIMRLVRNDRLEPETVDDIKDDLDYYLDAYEEAEYLMAYDEDSFYEPLGLDGLDVVNVDRVTHVSSSSSSSKKKDDDTSASSGSRKVDKASKKSSAVTGMIPLTIGRARVASSGTKDKDSSQANSNTPTKIGRAGSNVSSSAPAPALGPAPTPTVKNPPLASGGTSMAAILKRERETEERQKAALQAQQQALQEQQARQAELLRQQQLQKQQEAQLRQQEALRQQQAAQAQQKAAQAEALKSQQAQQLLEQQTRQQQQQAQQQTQQQSQQDSAKQMLLQQQALSNQQVQQPNGPTSAQPSLSLRNVNLGSLSLDGSNVASAPLGPSGTQPLLASLNSNSIGSNANASNSKDASERYLTALNESFLHIPTASDADRQRSYVPRNPYPSPSCYPSAPSPIFENPAVFEKLGTDCLFFIFYYAQGTYQQYLAARELKKQSWRYHKKYMTWFQRHEEPKVTTDDYEQGTYVYFDYETGWCQRIKSDFRFEYSYLEDSLSV